MTDHADVIFKAWQHGGWMGARPLIDALVAERDEARSELDETVEAYHARLREKSAAEARVTELEAAFRGKCDCGHIHDRDTGCGDCSCDLWTCAALAKEDTA